MKVQLERWGRNVLAVGLSKLLGTRRITAVSVRAAWEQGAIQNILLIRPHQGLGDLLLASPIFRVLKGARPSLQLHFLASVYNAVAVRGNPHLDKIWVLDKKSMYQPRAAIAFVRALRAERYDLAIIISSHVPSFTSFLLARLSGARIVMAYATQGDYGGANWSRTLADLQIPKPAPETPEFETFMKLLLPLGVGGSYEPEFAISPEARALANKRWADYRFPPDRRTVGLYLGGNPDRPERLWGPSAWAGLARNLLDKGLTVIAIVPPTGMVSGSGRPEPGVYEEFCKNLGQRPPLFSDPQLENVAAFLTRLDLFVCPDGGLMHIAIASRVRTLGLCFETDPSRWVPPVAWAVGLRASDARSSGLTAEQVCEAVERQLRPAPTKP